MSAFTADESRTASHLLLGQTFICPLTYPELFQLLRDSEFVSSVNTTLNGLGYKLSQVGDADNPEVFFCAVMSMDDPRDRQHVEKRLLEMRDQIGAFIDFFRLVDHAGQGGVVSGGEVSFSKLLLAIEGHRPYLDQLRDLQAHKLFDSSKNVTDNGERLKRVLKVMHDQGYLVRRNASSTVYAFTGKIAYLQRIMSWLADHHRIEVIKPEDRSAFQEGLL